MASSRTMAADLRALKDAKKRNEVVGTINRLPSGNNNWPREEIDIFITRIDTCNLFLLALRALQDNSKQQDPWSWYGIASIHGLPYAAWNNITQASAIPGQIPANPNDPVLMPGNNPNANTGYCSHNSVLFPSWHRPYMAMMEQAIYLKCAEIAETFPAGATRIRYREAATRFRLPYFDPLVARVLVDPGGGGETTWACGMPQILSTRRVMVDVPDWRKTYLKEIDNPLYSYNFEKVRVLFKPPKPRYAFDANPPMRFTELWEPLSDRRIQEAAQANIKLRTPCRS